MAAMSDEGAAASAAMATRRDALLGRRLVFHQPARGYRAAVDPVLLAAAMPALRAGRQVLDLGCGAGAALLCLAWRQPELRITGLERDAALADLAATNICENGLAGRCAAVTGDVAHPPESVARTGAAAVMLNPPYETGDQAAPLSPAKTEATQEDALALAGWLDAAARRLRAKGWLVVIQRADRLDALLAGLAEAGLGEAVIVPVWPKPGRAAGRVLVRARKGIRARPQLAPGLVLHNPDGSFTPTGEAVLAAGAPLPEAALGRSPASGGGERP